jgi:hypothetical protein
MENKNKVAVVTACILIDFDKLDECGKQFEKEKSWDYILFTNDKNKIDYSDIWDIREIDCSRFKHGVHATKHIKWLTHEYLEDYEIIIWVDSFVIPNINMIDEIKKMIENVKQNEDLIYIRTQTFKNVNEDIEWCLNNKRMSKRTATNVIEYLNEKEGFSVYENGPTYWSSAMIKNNKGKKIKNMSNELFLLVESIGHRDQHWLPMLLTKHDIKTITIKNVTGKSHELTDKDIFIESAKQIRENHDYERVMP